MYGMPYHSITSHFPEWFRIVALRSLNAECQERYFKDIKSTTKSTNYQPDHILVNSLVRLEVKRGEKELGKSLPAQESVISRHWAAFSPRINTVIDAQIIRDDEPSFAAHRERIADYLLDGHWHQETSDGSYTFFDGEKELASRDGPNVILMHFR